MEKIRVKTAVGWLEFGVEWKRIRWYAGKSGDKLDGLPCDLPAVRSAFRKRTHAQTPYFAVRAVLPLRSFRPGHGPGVSRWLGWQLRKLRVFRPFRSVRTFRTLRPLGTVRALGKFTVKSVRPIGSFRSVWIVRSVRSVWFIRNRDSQRDGDRQHHQPQLNRHVRWWWRGRGRWRIWNDGRRDRWCGCCGHNGWPGKLHWRQSVTELHWRWPTVQRSAGNKPSVSGLPEQPKHRQPGDSVDRHAKADSDSPAGKYSGGSAGKW